ncbi:2-oxo-4-hydroxy-4-carboxy-5-ureidoimidazoline decarboxylase [Jatrophihabitans telluris]|uniref:2-oxo-4-hydroxy-4-carboxy-5-ureidoimidazoline decarboxylase n=1 Tax=Jatrophihabitans telluris TaxID=2038343 RepID=A0ABY4QZ61_9ACTN|nr:2-oxo-4-hydroxy-4-carboxy-5-ureidoimidazoline decarboxylase [Jatrophihabitans telluris]UQX88200.1 2-oxo-4-hydroxy-4-carboxy-5-ureidoimidazoline decarboxylase [Jatrophihabitans telluris]
MVAAEPTEPIAVAEFDQAPAPDAAAELVPCCASRRWVSQLVKGRPYASLTALAAASDALLKSLDWQELSEALAAHPRIGDHGGGGAGGNREASWSRQEQSSTATAGDEVRARLREANIAYEQRFGHVFLICATGLSAEDMLASLRSRLDNDPVAEREVVRAELGKIVKLRLAKTFR